MILHILKSCLDSNVVLVGYLKLQCFTVWEEYCTMLSCASLPQNQNRAYNYITTDLIYSFTHSDQIRSDLS